MDIAPNITSFPSAPWNSPQLMPFIGIGEGDLATLSEVDELANISDPNLDYVATPQGPRNQLMHLRAMFPYLPIMPFPPQSVSIALTQNVAYDVNVPDGSCVMLLDGNNDFYASLHGRAETPGVDGLSKSLYKPVRYPFYVGNVRQFSIIAPNANTIVTAMFYIYDELPR